MYLQNLKGGVGFYNKTDKGGNFMVEICGLVHVGLL